MPKKSIFNKAVSLILILYPIINIYLIGGYSLSLLITLLLLCAFVYRVLTRKVILKNCLIPKGYSRYCIFWLISALFSTTWVGLSSLTALPGILYNILFILLFLVETDFDQYLRYYRILAPIFIVFLFVQEAMYMSLGYRTPGLIPWLDLNINNGDTIAYQERVLSGVRSSSVFSEPAHFAQWLLPFLAYELLLDERKNHYIFALISIIALLLLRSGNAMFGMIPIFVIFLIKLIKQKKYKFLFFIIVFLVSFAGYALSSNLANDILSRKDELHVGANQSEVQESTRLYRGYFVFAEYSTIEKILGESDIPTLINYIKKSKVSYLFEENDTYFNCVQSVLIKTGFIGLFLFLLIWMEIYRDNFDVGKSIVLSFLILIPFSSLFFTYVMAQYMVLSIGFKSKRKYNV